MARNSTYTRDQTIEILARRHRENLTLEQLAESTGVSLGTLKAWSSKYGAEASALIDAELKSKRPGGFGARLSEDISGMRLRFETLATRIEKLADRVEEAADDFRDLVIAAKSIAELLAERLPKRTGKKGAE